MIVLQEEISFLWLDLIGEGCFVTYLDGAEELIIPPFEPLRSRIALATV